MTDLVSELHMEAEVRAHDKFSIFRDAARVYGGTPKPYELYLAEDVCGRAAIEIDRLRTALESIAKNTCCDKCREAALVARAALGQGVAQ